MSTVDLKSDLHKILDKIDNEELLRTVYDFLKEGENTTEGAIWKTLTENQRKEVFLSFEESDDETKLVNWEDIKKKY